MSFVSIDFIIFFPVVCSIYYFLPKKMRNIWLLCCSYFFYMCWNAKYAVLMLGATIVTFLCGIGIEIAGKKHKTFFTFPLSKVILGIGIFYSIIILFFFKYFNFSFLSLDRLLTILRLKPTELSVNILLPVGISFYTFQTLGYIIDVYRGEVRAEKNFVDYAVFVSFFPQLVAGPIERSKRLLYQIKDKHDFSADNFYVGAWYIIWGFFLKLVIADRIAIYVDLVYSNLDIYKGLYIIIATMLFALQIYCDFNGYTLIAKGTAKILGYELMDNFKAPYLAFSVTDFWRRWHISLTSWFRDYLYIPLGGNRRGKIRKHINTLVVFLCSGLWHGAAWGYVFWGGLNGLYIIFEEISLPLRKELTQKLGIKGETISHKIANIIMTFILIDFSWTFFRAASIRNAWLAIKNSILYFNPEILFDGSITNMWISAGEILFLGLAVLLLLWVDYMKNKGISVIKIILEQEFWFRVILFSGLLLVVFYLGIYGKEYDSSKFIYFQF